MTGEPLTRDAAMRDLSAILPSPIDTEFLRACLHDGAAGREAWTRWSRGAGDWPARLAREPAHRTSLLPLLYRALKKNGVRLADDETTCLREAWLMRAVESRTYLAVCDGVLKTLVRADLPCVVLKGAALGRTVYPDPVLRPASDVDLLLRERDLLPAAAALRAAGWRWKEPPIDFGRHHLSPLVHESGLTVELHRRLFSAYYDVPIESLWERRRACTLGGVPVHELSPEHALIHVCGHAARCGTRATLRWVADAWFLLHAHPEFEWPRFVDATIRGRLGLPLAIMIGYLADDIGAPVPAGVLDELRDAAARTDATGLEAARLGIGASGVLRLQDLTIEKVRRRLFPPASEIRLAHGVDDAHAPGYQAYRLWCFVLRTVRRS